jgi:NAD(P)-dependent dehydrogenase (short-subunit alcohol dehydrogenase family)
MSHPFDLTGHVAVVTGSSKGIGRSIAEHLSRAGARVVISSRKEGPCQEVAAAIRETGGEAIAIPANVSHHDDLVRLVGETHEKLGKIGILVCNAAANPYYGPLEDISDSAYHKTMDTNILSALRLCSMVKPDMVELGGGAMIVVSSVGAFKASTVIGAYDISKAADVSLVRHLALEWGKHNIRINSLLPGLVKTDFARALWDTPEAEKRTVARFPLGRLGEPDDLGPAAVFLASRAGAWMTGQSLVIDGGELLSH